MKIKDWNLFTESSYSNSSITELCSPFFEEIESIKNKNILYRGDFSVERGEKIGSKAYLIKSRKDRIPSETAPEVSNLIDKFSKEKFGFKIRSEGLFTTKLHNVANGYGDAYIFLPVGDYKYVWNYNIDDLFVSIIDEDWYPDRYTQKEIIDKEGFFDMKSYMSRDDVQSEVKKIVDKYIIGDKHKSSLSEIGSQEVTFFCDQYILLETGYDIHKYMGMSKYVDPSDL